MHVMAAIDGCHYWTARCFDNGYGQFKVNYKNLKAHRASYMFYKGEIPSGMIVCHSCDNPKCVNPDHLFLGTNKDNYNDMVKKGRKWPITYGEDAHHTKLNEGQVKEILSLKGVLSQSKIAKKFGVSQGNIWWILSGKGWKHLTGGENARKQLS